MVFFCFWSTNFLLWFINTNKAIKKGGHLVAVYIDGMGFDLIEAKWLSITELPEKPRKLK